MKFLNNLKLQNFSDSIQHAFERRSNLVSELPRDIFEFCILIRIIIAPVVRPTESQQDYDSVIYSPSGVSIENKENIDPLRYWILKDCYLYDNGIIINSKNQLVMLNMRGRWLEMSKRIRMYIDNRSDFLFFLKSPVKFFKSLESIPVNDPALYYTGPYIYNYYHWMLEKLPTLRAIPKLNESDIRPSIILNSDSPDFVKESIELINPDVKKIASTNAVCLNLSDAIIPEERPFSGNDYSGTEQEIDFIRHHLLKDRLIGKENFNYIFSTRADSDSRKIKNRQELENYLSEYGFISLIAGKHSVKDQIALFKHADVVMGPHGANLVNIIFCRRARIYEIVGADPHNRLYELLCEAIGHEHQYLHGKKIGRDFYIPISEIESKFDTKINT